MVLGGEQHACRVEGKGEQQQPTTPPTTTTTPPPPPQQQQQQRTIVIEEVTGAQLDRMLSKDGDEWETALLFVRGGGEEVEVAAVDEGKGIVKEVPGADQGTPQGVREAVLVG